MKGWAGRAEACRECGAVVLITGASQGLGRAFAGVMARLGLDLALTALPGSGLEEVGQDLRAAYGVRVATVAVDLATPAGPEALAAWVEDQGLEVGVLINNAGVSYNRRFEMSSLQENEACILLNNLALVKVTRLLLPALRQQPAAYVLNVASLAAFYPMPTQSVYAPSKAFVLNFSLALREEMRRTPVCVSVLCPGGIPTHPASLRKLEVGGVWVRASVMRAERVAEIAVRRMFARQAVIVPGAANRALAELSRFVPRALVFALMGRIWGRTAETEQGAEAPGGA